MGAFTKAKRKETREAFVADRISSRKYSEDMLEEMREYILSDECVRDLERLEAGDYFLDYPHYRLVPKGFQDRKRAVYSIRGTQGFLVKLIVYAMRDLDNIYSDRLFSFRTDKTAGDLLHEVRDNNEIRDMYVLKTDVSNYVGSIVPELLVPMLHDVFMPDDPAAFHFLEWLVMRKKVIDHDGEVIEHCPGGLGGVPVSNFFMNLYLREADELFASKAAFYSRYSDDILICARTYDGIRECEKELYAVLDRLQLSLNNDKTQIYAPGEAFELLGMEICGESIRISDYSMKKIKRKLRMFTNRALRDRNAGKMTPDEAAHNLVIKFNRYLFGAYGAGNLMSWARWSFPVITDISSLKEIDHYIQDSVRYALYGSMKKRRYTVPYEKLAELGYKSLVYYYYHKDRIEDIPREYPKREAASGE